MTFWPRIMVGAKLAWSQQLEYRFNLFVDSTLQPLLTAVVEMALWFGIVKSLGAMGKIGGFPVESYLHYALWTAFIARISANWMYEYRMIDEVQTGSVNVILTRPISFYFFYLSQFLSYKVLTTVVSLGIPLVISSWIVEGPTDVSRLPLALSLVSLYLVLIYTLSFIVTCFAFTLNKVNSFTAAKNFTIWCLSGELIPIDLAPPMLKSILLNLPFASGVFVPVGYVTGRVEIDLVWHSFMVTLVSISVFGFIAYVLWKRGLKSYSGTGA